MKMTEENKKIMTESDDKTQNTIIQKLIDQNLTKIDEKTEIISDDEYIKRMKSGDEKAREKLIVNNKKLVAYISNTYSYAGEIDELYSAGLIGLIKGIDSFNPEKGIKLSTYLYICIENQILRYLKENSRQLPYVSLEETIHTSKDGEEIYLKEVLAQDSEVEPSILVENKMITEEIIEYMKKNLSERAFSIMILRFGLFGQRRHTQKEVSKLIHVSRQIISKIETQSINMLRTKFNPVKDNNQEKLD
ncbi:MAG: sigma-70 family RNA polymerase sigma factor [Candidatus Onthoplasma sp.]